MDITNKTNKPASWHEDYYKTPLYYDIAFDFRETAMQADFFEQVFAKYTGRKLTSIIELGFGPGYFILEFARRNITTMGLDLSPEMLEYTQEKLSSAGLNARLIQGDMLNFKLEEPVDMALLLMDSASYILTSRDFVNHLQCVAENLKENGIYFMEFSHPGDDLKSQGRVQSRWTAERDGIIVETCWGMPEDAMDVIEQITQTTVRLKVNDHGREFELFDTAPQKFYSAQEVLALVQLSGVFRFAGWYGDFKMDQPLDNSNKSWRMNIVLQKI